MQDEESPLLLSSLHLQSGRDNYNLKMCPCWVLSSGQSYSHAFLPPERIIFLRVSWTSIHLSHGNACVFFCLHWLQPQDRQNCVLWLTQEMIMTQGVNRTVMKFHCCIHAFFFFLENSLRLSLLANWRFLMKKFPSDFCNKVYSRIKLDTVFFLRLLQ